MINLLKCNDRKTKAVAMVEVAFLNWVLLRPNIDIVPYRPVSESITRCGFGGSCCDQSMLNLCVFSTFSEKTRRLDLGQEDGPGEQAYVVGCWGNLVYFQQVRTIWIFFS